MHTNFGYKNSGLGLVGYFEKNPGTRRILPGNTRKIMYYKKGRAKPFSRGGAKKLRNNMFLEEEHFWHAERAKLYRALAREKFFAPL